ncbi:MAG: transcriptional regulator [Deltaproteobacteria bacterium]|nr:transcriptional regulator [Deltaproteobacteria bacterium]
MDDHILLKKYSNRRLYDTKNSTYVTLNQVADMIRGGQTVEVFDAGTGDDVTAFILTQIIVEEARTRNSLLPVPFLHMVIRFGDTVLKEFFENYLQQTVQNYLSYKDEMDKHFRKWLEVSADFSEAAKQTMQTMSPFQSLFEGEFPQRKGKDTKKKKP